MNARSSQRVTLEVMGNAVTVEISLGEVRVDVHMLIPPGGGEMSAAQFRSTVLNSARRAIEVARQELE
jgi:hypothetical protein